MDEYRKRQLQDAKEIGARVKDARVRAGLRQRDLARALGVSERAYGAIEQGGSTSVFTHIGKIAQTIGEDPDVLLGRSANDKRIVGLRLREARKRVGLLQTDVADAIGVTPATYGGYERGEGGVFRSLPAIAELLDTTPEAIMDGAPSEDERASARVEALEREVAEMRALLLDPDKLRELAERVDRTR